MVVVADASVAIRGDMTGFHRDLTGAERATGGFAGRIKNILSPRNVIGAAGLFGVGLGVRQLVGYAGDAAQAYSELEQTVRTIDSVFGDSAGVIRDWGATAAETAGMSQQTFMSSAAVMGETLQNMGFQREEAADTTVQLLQRAADMALAFGKRPQDALLAITAAMRGERDTIEKFGVAIKQVDVNARIAALGLDTSTAAALKNAEAMAVVDLVLEQSQEQAGRFARAEGETAREMAEAQARIDDFMANDVGQAVASIQLGAIKVVDAVGEATEDIGTFFDDAFSPEVNAKVQTFADSWGVGFHEARDRIREGADAAGQEFQTHLDHLVALSEGAGQELGNAGERIGKDYSLGLGRARPVVETAAAEGIQDPVFDALMEAEDNAGKSGHQVVIEYAKGLLLPQNDVQIAIDAALQVVEDEMGETEEFAYLSGQKVVLEEARGIALQEGKDAAVLAIDGALGLIEERMEALTANAAIHGGNLITSYVGGMYLNMPAISDAAYEMASRVSSQTQIQSEPPDHNSPLYGITKWGGNLVDTYAGGILSRLGTASSAAGALAGALVPAFGGGAMGSLSTPSGGIGNTYHVSVNDLPQHPTLAEIGGELKRLGDMGKLPGAKRE